MTYGWTLLDQRRVHRVELGNVTIHSKSITCNLRCWHNETHYGHSTKRGNIMKQHITTTIFLALVLALGLIENASTLAGHVSSRRHEAAVLNKLLASIMLLFDDEPDAKQNRFTVINTAGMKAGKGVNTILVGTAYIQLTTAVPPIAAAATASATSQPPFAAAETALTMRSIGTSAPATVPRAQDEPIGLGSIVLSTILATLALVIVLRAIARRRR